MKPPPPASSGPSGGIVLVVVVGAALALFGGSALGITISAPTSLLMVAALLSIVALIDFRAALAALVFCIGFSPEVSLGDVSNLRYEDLMMPVLCFGWLSQMVRNREPFVSTPLNAPIAAIIVVAVLSSLLGVVQGYVEPVFTGFRIGKVIVYYVIFWLFLHTIRSRAEFEGIVLTILVTGVASGIAAILGSYQEGGEAPSRAAGPEGEGANIFGGYIMTHCAILIGMFLAAATMRARLLYAGGVLVTFWALMLTWSRTSYVGLAIGLVLVGLLRRRSIFGWIVVLAILFQMAMPPQIIERAKSIMDVFGEHKPSSWNARVQAWHSLSRMIFTDPLLGRGVGVVGLSAADNEYMLQLVQCGVLGLAVFLWMLWRQMRICAEAEQITKGDPIAEGFSIGSSLAIVCLSIHGLGATSFTSIRTMEQFMVVMGTVGALHCRYPQWVEQTRAIEENRRFPVRASLRPVLRPVPRPGL